ncbi:hypothetical protein [Desulfurobacterium sp.]
MEKLISETAEEFYNKKMVCILKTDKVLHKKNTELKEELHKKLREKLEEMKSEEQWFKNYEIPKQRGRTPQRFKQT